MAKAITQTVADLKETRNATEPMTIVKVSWADGPIYYADTAINIEGLDCLGTVSELGSLTSVSKTDSVSEYSSISVGLIDADGFIKSQINSQPLGGTTCEVYHYYRNTARVDLTLLLTGRMESAIWDEGTRVLSFNIETIFETETLGYKSEAYAFPGFDNDKIGAVWPTVFGTCVEVEALKIRGTSNRIALKQTFNEKATQIKAQPTIVNGLPTVEIDIEYTFSFFDFKFNAILREDAESSTGYHLEVVEFNLPKYTSIIAKMRPTESAYRTSKWAVFVDPQYQLSNCWVLINGYYNYCLWQNGDVCYFEQAWPWLVGDSIGPSTINSVAPIVRQDWSGSTALNLSDNYYANLELNRVNGYRARKWYYLQEYINGAREVVPGRFQVTQLLNAGQHPAAGTETTDGYIVSSIPAAEIIDVWAWRNYLGERIYAQVPSSYYNTYLNYNFGDGRYCTAITFDYPLTERTSEEWEDNIFVTMRSSVNHEVTTQLRYIIDNFTPFSVDEASFSAVRSKTKDFWCCHVLRSEVDAMQLISDLAWQSRCAIISRNNVLSLVFLPEMGASTASLDESWIGTESLRLSHSPLDDVKTSITAEWRHKDSDGDDLGNDRSYTYENNVSTYGLKEETLKIDKFNMEYAVQACIDFWGYRRSNLWRIFELKSFMNILNAEVFDVFTNAIDTLSTNTIRGEVSSLARSDDTIDLRCQLASQPTDVDGSNQPVENPNYWPGNPELPTDTIDLDPAFGRSEADYNPQVKYEASEESPVIPVYRFLYVNYPSTVVRDDIFSMEVHIVDQDGNVRSDDSLAIATLNSSDAADTLNVSNIVFSNGRWASDSLQISDGADNDTGTIKFAAVEVTTSECPTFDIVDVGKQVYVWTVPNNIVRDVPFTITIENCPPNGTVNIALNSTDKDDGVFVGSTPVTSVQADNVGVFQATDWVVRGGNNTDSGSFQASDPANSRTPAASQVFGITGLSTQYYTENIGFNTEASQTIEEIKISTLDLPIIEGTTFHLACDFLDNDDNILTSYNGTGVLTIKGDDSSLRTLTDLGPDASIAQDGLSATITFIGGGWAFNDCEIDFGADTDLLIVTTTVDLGEGGTVIGTADLEVGGVQEFRIDMPKTVTDGVVETIQITAIDIYGQVEELYLPDDTIQLEIFSDGDVVSVFPEYVNIGDWSAGVATIDVSFHSVAYSLATLHVEENGRIGDFDFQVGGTTVQRSAVRETFLAGSSSVTMPPEHSETGEPEWDEQFETGFSRYVNSSWSGTPTSGVCLARQRHYLQRITSYHYCQTDFETSTASFPISQIEGDQLMGIGLRIDVSMDYGPTHLGLAIYEGSLRIMLNGSGFNMYTGASVVGGTTSGWTVRADVGALIQHQIQAGTTPLIYLPQSAVDYVKSMSGEKLYVTIFFDLPSQGYRSFFWDLNYNETGGYQYYGSIGTAVFELEEV